MPSLGRAIYYDRAVGFFSSAVFTLIGIGLSGIALAGGEIHLVCSPRLSREDVDVLKEGADVQDRVDAAVLSELRVLLEHSENVPPLRLAAALMAFGTLHIQVAYPASKRGIFHDKLGILTDVFGDSVSFKGSNNETAMAWDEEANHESFEVFRSWMDGDAARVARHRAYFESLWRNEVPGIVVRPLAEVPAQVLRDLAVEDDVLEVHREVRELYERLHPPTPRSGRDLQPHQFDVLESWRRAGHRGVIDHVTGGGKTITALAAIAEWTADGKPALVVVPTKILVRQWAREAQRSLPDGTSVLLAFGEGDPWRSELRDFTSSDRTFGPRLTIATNSSAVAGSFLDRVQPGAHLLVVADEVHHVGAPVSRRLLGVESGGRLGLSATPERYGDPDGTDALMAYFGPILPPHFGIADGIAAGRLVPYDYFVHLVQLTSDEWEEWARLSEQISALIARSSAVADQEDADLSSRVQHLLIARARLKKKARSKAALAVDIVRANFEHDQRWLIYCDDTEQLNDVGARLRAGGFTPSEYHSAMEGDPEETLKAFEAGPGILVAIRCLDEGIDVPGITHALILASSTNRREFLQRRGRVLRVDPSGQKLAATIHDVLVSGSGGEPERTLLPGELQRAREFAIDARNSAIRHRLVRLAALSDIDIADDVEDEAAEDEVEPIISVGAAE